MKTDPENADYTVEKGATRNYEPWRDKDRATAEAVAQREEEERGNAMKVIWESTLLSPAREYGVPPSPVHVRDSLGRIPYTYRVSTSNLSMYFFAFTGVVFLHQTHGLNATQAEDCALMCTACQCQ